MTRNHVYMAVTPDEYELPLAVADTAKELANCLGPQPATFTRKLAGPYPAA